MFSLELFSGQGYWGRTSGINSIAIEISKRILSELIAKFLLAHEKFKGKYPIIRLVFNMRTTCDSRQRVNFGF